MSFREVSPFYKSEVPKPIFGDTPKIETCRQIGMEPFFASIKQDLPTSRMSECHKSKVSQPSREDTTRTEKSPDISQGLDFGLMKQGLSTGEISPYHTSKVSEPSREDTSRTEKSPDISQVQAGALFVATNLSPLLNINEQQEKKLKEGIETSECFIDSFIKFKKIAHQLSTPEWSFGLLGDTLEAYSKATEGFSRILSESELKEFLKRQAKITKEFSKVVSSAVSFWQSKWGSPESVMEALKLMEASVEVCLTWLPEEVLKGKAFQAILGITDHKVFKIFTSEELSTFVKLLRLLIKILRALLKGEAVSIEDIMEIVKLFLNSSVLKLLKSALLPSIVVLLEKAFFLLVKLFDVLS